MPQPKIVISINSSWNVINFRSGLVRALQEAGYEVVALAPPDDYSQRLPELGVSFAPIEIDKQGLSPLNDLRLAVRYWSALRSIRPAVFLGYTVKPNIYGSLAAHALRIPTINNVAGLGTAFISRGPLAAIVSRLYRLALRPAQTVFFQNCEDMELFLDKSLVRRGTARLLPGSGIDLSRFPAAPPVAREPGELRFLLVARLIWDKGVREFVEAARLLRARGSGARFQILGFLDVENRTAVPRSQVEQWVGEGLIEYLGAAEDVRPYLAQSDCVVLPSYREGLPRVLLEGAGAHKPLIATDVPGCRQVVEDAVNGFLCEARSPQSLAAAMMKMAELPEERRREMGARGRKLVEEVYDERIVIAAYLQAISEAIGADRPALRAQAS